MTTQQNGEYPVLGYVTLTLAANDENKAHEAAENIKRGSDFGSGGYIVDTEMLEIPQGDGNYITAIAAQCEASSEEVLAEMQVKAEELAEAITGVDGVEYARHYVEHKHPLPPQSTYIRGYLYISDSTDPSRDAQQIMASRSIYRNGSDNNVGVITRADVVTSGADVQVIVAPYVAYTSDTVPVMENGIREVVDPNATITRFTVQQYEDYHGHPELPQRQLGREEMHELYNSHGNSYG